MITAFVSMLWLNWEYGFNVFMERPAKLSLSQIFVGQIEKMKTLEDSLCDYAQFGFEKVNIDFDSLKLEEYRFGRALALTVDLDKPGKGWWQLYKRHRKETVNALSFKPEILRHVEITKRKIIKKVNIVEI